MEKMEKIVIKASRRNIIGKQVGVLRRAGKLPGVMYGYHIEPTPIVMDLREVTMSLMGITTSHIISIDLDGTEHTALVKEKQRDYVRGTLQHVDFLIVSLTEKIRTNVSVELIGESPAVKNYNGVVVAGLAEIDVESLPQDLPERFVVDVSKLAEIGDSIYVKDLDIPTGVHIYTDPSEVLVVITAGAAEEMEAEAVELPEPEVIERGKKEELEDE